jgi:hypothetical protein
MSVRMGALEDALRDAGASAEHARRAAEEVAQMRHEPFAQTWFGISLQIFISAVLAYLTYVLWTR